MIKGNKRFARITAGATLWAVFASASAQMIYQTDFSSGIGEWNYSGNTTTRVVQGPDGQGAAAHFTLTPKDRVPYRTELVMDSAHITGEARNAKFGVEYWYGVSIWLDDYRPDENAEILFQFHEVPDRDLGEKYRNPPLAIGVEGDRWLIVNRGDTKRVTPNRQSYTHYKRYDAGKFESGRWTHWVARIVWSHGSNGVLQIWRDGELVVDQKGTNTFNDRVGPYLKIGLYKYYWQNRKATKVSRRSVYVGDLRIARGENLFDLVNTGGAVVAAPAQPSPVADVATPVATPPAKPVADEAPPTVAPDAEPVPTPAVPRSLFLRFQ